MGEKKVRRLPVVNASNKLEGILSMDDVVLHADAKNSRLKMSSRRSRACIARRSRSWRSKELPGLDAKEDALAVVESDCFIEGGQ
jgi:CBS domain-containing protein